MSRAIVHAVLISLGLAAGPAFAGHDLGQEMDALGANQDLVEKARAVDPDNRVRVVQNRDVDRYNRLELGVSGTLNLGGDSYVNTTSLGLNADYHLTPHWSLGARYTSYSNALSHEGQSAYDSANQQRQSNPNYSMPKVDYARDSYLAVINWYPVYGKINMFDQGIVQFDVYLLGGAGQINLATGSAPLYTGGAGMGFWLTKHLTTRFEARWQGYRDLDGSRAINETVLGMSIGFLL